MLHTNQKAYLAQLARRAFNLEGARARGRGEAFDSSCKAFDAWRQQEVGKACGKLGLRCCDQRDYRTVEGHFLNLLGQPDKALNSFVKAQSEERRQVQFKIKSMCQRLGKPLDYAHGVCRQMFRGLAYEDASDAQLWKVFFALKYQLERETKYRNDFQEV
jgi:ribosomal protein S14